VATTSTASRNHLFAVIAFTLLAIAFVRAALIVAHAPVLGYADPADLHNVAGCFSLAPAQAERVDYGLPRPPVAYRGGGNAPCYVSSAMLLDAPAALARALGGADAAMPLQVFGIVNLAFFAALAVWIALALRGHSVAGVAHGLVLILLIADPVATLWFNTLNTEPAALLGTYASVAAVAIILLRDDNRMVDWVLLGAGLAMVGLARGQFSYLPLLLALVLAPALFARSRRRAWGILAVGAAVAIAQFAIVPLRPEQVGPVDRTDEYLGLILSSSKDAPATLEHLGLPARCEKMAGASWSKRRGENLDQTCPEVTSLSSFAFARLLASEPLTLLRAVSRVLPAAQAIIPGYLGIAASGPIVTVADLPPQEMSFVALLTYVPSMVFAAIIVALIVASPVAFIWLAWTVRSEPRRTVVPAVFLMLVAIGGYTLFSTAFGEGLVGAERHHWLGALATLAAVLMLPLVTWVLTEDQLRARIAVAAAFGVLLLAAGWLLWARNQPLSVGSIEKIETRGTTLGVLGWALDPWAVHRVYASVGGGPVTEGTLGIERQDLQRTYPGYPQALTGGYEIAIAPNAWRENEELRVYVESRSGAVTEIDRRVIRLRP
jgi:hypothetical protein